MYTMTILFILAFIACFFMFILPDALTAQEHEVNNRIRRSMSYPEPTQVVLGNQTSKVRSRSRRGCIVDYAYTQEVFVGSNKRVIRALSLEDLNKQIEAIRTEVKEKNQQDKFIVMAKCKSHPEYVEIGSSKIGWSMIVLGLAGMIVVPIVWLFV